MNYSNQATVSYNNNQTAKSNIVNGTILSPFTLSKSSFSRTYQRNSIIQYRIIVTNSLDIQITNAYVFDDMGVYSDRGVLRIPSNFDLFSCKLLIVSQSGAYSRILGVNRERNGVGFMFILPGKSTAIITYSASINDFADTSPASSIKSNVSLNAGSYEEITTTHTIKAATYSDIVLTKFFKHDILSSGQPANINLIVSNYGNEASSPSITDIIHPYMKDLVIKGNSEEWTSGDEYNYDSRTGYLNIKAGAFTIPPATFFLGSLGRHEIIPSTYDININGTVISANAPEPYISIIPAYTDGQEKNLLIEKINVRLYKLTVIGNIVPKLEILTNPASIITLEPSASFKYENSILTVDMSKLSITDTAIFTIEYGNTRLYLMLNVNHKN